MIFIPHNVPSSKNSRVNTSRGSFHSPAVSKYLQKLGIRSYSVSRRIVLEYKDEGRPNLFREAFDGLDLKNYKPLIIGYHPVRNSKRKFDLHNTIQILADLMQAHEIIEDDSAEYFVAMPMAIGGKYYSYDPDNPGVYLKVLN